LQNPETTLILEEDFASFDSIDFFPIDLDYRVLATLKKTEDKEIFRLTYSDDPDVPVLVKYGELHFILNGEECTLNVYQNESWIDDPQMKENLFLPFTDWTNGPVSYGGGRFIDLKIPSSGNEIELDFNKSYNPPCTYNYYLACPLIPESNYIEAEVNAGILAFETY